MTSQHFGSLRLTQRKRTETGQGRQEQKNSFLRIYPHELFFFSDTSHRHYRFGSKGGILLDCLTFFFPVEEHCCNAATVNLLRTVRALKTLPSALREGIWTHLSRAVVKCKPSVLKNLPVLANIIYQPGRQAVVNYT